MPTPSYLKQALSLAQLSISSKTVDFPAGHVPSVMGAKGHGRKRGRINHFAVKTPSAITPPGREPNLVDRAPAKGDGDSAAGSEPHSTGLGTSSGWNLPHELDPTSVETSGGNGTRRHARAAAALGTSSATLNTIHADNSISGGTTDFTVSKASSCVTINSPGRISQIVHGVYTGISDDHQLHPPPPVHHQPRGDGEVIAPLVMGAAAPSASVRQTARWVGKYQNCYSW